MGHVDQVYIGIFLIFAGFAVKIISDGMKEIKKGKHRLKMHKNSQDAFLQKIEELEREQQDLDIQKEQLESELNDSKKNDQALETKVAKLENQLEGKSKAKRNAALGRLHGA